MTPDPIVLYARTSFLDGLAPPHGRLGKPGRRIGSEEAQASRRFESILSGELDEVKQVAFRMALAAAN